MDFPTWVFRRKSLKLIISGFLNSGKRLKGNFFLFFSAGFWGSSAMITRLLQIQETFGVVPLPFFLLKFFAFIDKDLTVVSKPDPEPLQRTRRGAFKVDARFIKTAAVTGAFEF